MLDGLSLFGLFAVTAMMVCYALEPKSRWFVLGFALACGLGSVYGFLQGRLAVRRSRGGVDVRRLATLDDPATLEPTDCIGPGSAIFSKLNG